MKRRMFASLLSAALLVQSLGVFPASAEETNSVQNFVYDDYEVSYQVTNSWGDTEVVSVTLSNTGDDTIEDWMLYFDPNGEVQYTTDCQQLTTSDGISYFKNSGYNADVAPDSSVTFGYAVNDCEAVPESFTLCQKRETKTDGYTVSLNVNQSWGDSFSGEIVIQNNTDTAIEAWELTVDTNFTITEITNSWAASVTELEPYSYLLKGTYTGTVAANSSVSLGFIGVKDGEPEISSYSLTEVSASEEIINEASGNVDYTVSDLENMNSDKYYPVEVIKDENGYVTSIDGKFSNISVLDENSARKAISGVRTLLGITDPETELVLDYVYDSSESNYKSYFFHQVKNDVAVYGRSVTVVARDTGETLSLDSSFKKITSYVDNRLVSVDDIKSKYGVATVTETIYSYDEYSTSPVAAYLIETDEGIQIISAQTGSVICEIDETCYAEDNIVEYAAIDIYNVTSASEKDADGNLIYQRGDFGSVKSSSNDSYVLSFDDNELNTLKIDDNNIDFKFAEKGRDNYILQTISPSDYDEYIEKHDVITGICGYLGDSTDEDGNYYVDVAVDVYNFDEYYKDYKVYGRVVSLTVNDEGQTIIMDSNISDSEYLDDVEIPENVLTLSAVKSKNAKLENLETELDEPVLYTWDEYSDNPELVYIFLDKDNNRTYLVSAENADILNEDNEYYQLGKGLDEGGSSNGKCVSRSLQYFPVQSDGEMRTVIPNTVGETTYDNSVYVKYASGDTVCSDSTYFYEPEAVSAYLSVLTTYNFYADSPLNHNSYNNNITGEKNDFAIEIKQKSNVGAAASTPGYSLTTYRRNFDRVGYGANLSVIGHEYTHCVYQTYGNTRSNGTTSAALSEGYAGVMGNIINSWNGYNYDFDSKFTVDFEETSLDYLINDGYTTDQGHSLGEFISYPAYLMHENGFSDSEVALLYYTSITMGRYSETSNMNSVRINIIKAAKALNYSDEKMKIVTDAFDAIWGKSNDEYTFSFTIYDYDDASVELTDATITLKNSKEEVTLAEGQTGKFKTGWYTININADGYVPYNYSFYIGTSGDNRTMHLVKDGANNGIVTIRIEDFVNKQAVDDTVKLYTLDSDLNRTLVGEYQTGSTVGADTGYTQGISLAPGYYLAYVEDGYHYFQVPLVVSSGQSASQTVSTYYDLNLNPNETTDVYYFDVNIYSETPLADDLNFFTLAADHYYDSNNDKIAVVGRDSDLYGYRFYFYCYERENETFSIGFDIDSDDASILQNIVKKEVALTESTKHDCSGKLFNLEITFSNRQDPNYTHTIVLTASDLTEGFNSFATIYYDTDTQSYVTSTSY